MTRVQQVEMMQMLLRRNAVYMRNQVQSAQSIRNDYLTRGTTFAPEVIATIKASDKVSLKYAKSMERLADDLERFIVDMPEVANANAE